MAKTISRCGRDEREGAYGARLQRSRVGLCVVVHRAAAHQERLTRRLLRAPHLYVGGLNHWSYLDWGMR